MKKILRSPFLPLVGFLFLLLSLPKAAVDNIRSNAISMITPSWELVDNVKSLFSKKPKFASSGLRAKVIYREPSSWSSHLWINVGLRDNISVNAPVVIGKNVVGVIEEVLKKKSRVRLITDAQLIPSVRVKRGGERDSLLFERITSLTDVLETRSEIYGAEELTRALHAFKTQLGIDEKDLYLAKGQLHGASAPLWRCLGQKLKGIGFNYDFADEKGSSRSLRTSSVSLIKIGDLLVTTGMDGVFPEGLHVGVVSKIFPLHEGGISYELEANPLLQNLNSLTDVSILCPL